MRGFSERAVARRVLSLGFLILCDDGDVSLELCNAIYFISLHLIFPQADDGDVSLEFRNTDGAAAVAAMSTSISARARVASDHVIMLLYL